MNMITDPGRLDNTKMSPFFMSLMKPAAGERPTLAWQIDATTGKPVGRWLALPKHSDR